MVSKLIQEIRRAIQQQGKLTFAQFMDMALFSRHGGYYTSHPRGGDEGDFYTASLTHPLFGALVSLQLQQMWELLDRPPTFTVVEVGSGSGVLARDILDYAQHLPTSFRQALRYIAIERRAPLATNREVNWVFSHGIPIRDLVGCILSNELLDSFPVHRFAVIDGQIREVYVTLSGDQFVEVLDETSTPRIEERLLSLGADLAEGFRGEVNLALQDWVEESARSLQRGFVLTFDYGHLASDLYSPQRSSGTFRCYYHHTLGDNPYQHTGEQDITAHVDFTSLMHLGEDQGLATAGFTSQRQFLHNLGLSLFLDSINDKRITQRERDANRMAVLELVKPEGMGEFKVLAQAKGLHRDLQLHGFTTNNPLKKGLQARRYPIESPLLPEEHLDLLSARYPHLSWEWEELWPVGEGS